MKKISSGKTKKIHFIAVCGSGMGALACMLKDMGFEITGSDAKIYPPMSDFLQSKKVIINNGFKREHLSHLPDLVVIGNAVSRDNPEVLTVKEMGLDFCSMPEALNRFAAFDKKAVVVTGTHGKTTTSSLMAWVLYTAGAEPSFMIGGIVKDFSANYRLGSGEHIVIEGDEYDTAFFDKGPKFFHYLPHIAILTGIEFDHADIFRDIDHVKSVFKKFVSNINKSSSLIAYDKSDNIDEILSAAVCRVLRYGLKKESFWRIDNICIEPPYTIFEIYRGGDFFLKVKTRLKGEYNLLNALSVVAAADELKILPKKIKQGLETFSGILRRQDIVGKKNGITVMDDFAHHPTAVYETLRGIKPFVENGRLIAVFEPRTNSSMRNVFQNVYPRSFEFADVVCIRTPKFIDKIPENERFSSKKLVSDLLDAGCDAHYFKDTDSIINFLKKIAVKGDLILVMSNGGFDNIHIRLLDVL